VFGKLDTGERPATRLDLANWLVSVENPLTARVLVNRVWKQFFGIGLSRSLEDVGSQGEWPVHLELLDWLASEFVSPAFDAKQAHAWDLKHLVRVIVTSHTYRQSSLATSAQLERDPANRLLARQSRFRVDAELVRDTILGISGLLVEKFGGPSVRPFQPDGYWTPLSFPKREWVNDHGDNLRRRGLYTHWQRTFLHPELLAFDAPSREECSVNRPLSNTPLQALILLNDDTFVEAARTFAQNMMTSGGKRFDSRLDWAFRRALSRPATSAERKILNDLHQKELSRFKANPGAVEEFLSVGESPRSDNLAPDELAATTLVARAILNLHETITRN
jgi:hypothetical protein